MVGKKIEEVLYGEREKRKSIRQLDLRYQMALALKGQSLGGSRNEDGNGIRRRRRRRKHFKNLRIRSSRGRRGGYFASYFFPRKLAKKYKKYKKDKI